MNNKCDMTVQSTDALKTIEFVSNVVPHMQMALSHFLGLKYGSCDCNEKV